jgi:hypothetical protein
MTTLTCTSPAAGIGGGGAGTANSAQPTPSATTCPVTRTDENGNQTVVDNALIYNISGIGIPGLAACTLARTAAGRYYVTQCAAAIASNAGAYVNAIGPNGAAYATITSFGQGDVGYIGPLRF